MKSSKVLPHLNHRASVDDDEGSFPGRLHTVQRKLKISSSTVIKNDKNYDTFLKKAKVLPEAAILKQIDSKLEMHKKDIDQRNDMIFTIEKGFESVKTELAREKQINEERAQQLVELQASYHAIQLKLKQSADTSKQSDKDKERILQLESTVKQFTAKEKELQKNIEDLTAQLKTNLQTPKNSDLELRLKEIQVMKENMRKQEDKIKKLEEQLNDAQRLCDTELGQRKEVQSQYDKLKSDYVTKEQKQFKEIAALGLHVKQLETDKSHLNTELKKYQDANEKNQTLHDQIQCLKDKLVENSKMKDVLYHQIQKLINELRQDLEEARVKLLQSNDNRKHLDDLAQLLKSKTQALDQMTTQKQSLEQQVKETLEEVSKLNKQLELLKNQPAPAPKNSKQLTDTLIQLENTERDMQKNLSCTFCNKFIKQPVTIIPCGHSYCFDCKKGYQGCCSKCGPKLKVEAMYRNELLDDIIQMVKLIQASISSLKIATK